MDKQRFTFFNTGAVNDAILLRAEGTANGFRKIRMRGQNQNSVHLNPGNELIGTIGFHNQRLLRVIFHQHHPVVNQTLLGGGYFYP
jgi:hypothetical protein